MEKFKFSPPGPMGWSFAEYEKMLENHEKIVLNESAVEENLANLEGKPLQEYPSVGLVTEQVTDESLESVGVEDNLQSEKTEIAFNDSEKSEHVQESIIGEMNIVDQISGEEAYENKMYSSKGTKANLIKIINSEEPIKEIEETSTKEEVEKPADNQEKKQENEKQTNEKQTNEKQTNEKQTNEKQTNEKQTNEKQTNEKQTNEKQTNKKQTNEKQVNKKEKKSNKVIVPNEQAAPPWLFNAKEGKAQKRRNRKKKK
ncbi:hypothetical protein VQL36_17375 [Chengkuizengella sp. SCS-71B]|uniref:hypothetical protein n=1 Tax=Chengkuizengella sp. SCS-71B TaxID=3115290 RepID=UPI0032C226A0